MQGIGKRTRTHIASGLLGLYTLQAEIEKRKMILFGQLCNLASYSRIKCIFLLRLATYCRPGSNVSGYFCDISSILKKYNLEVFLSTYSSSGVFPTSIKWKQVVKSRVKDNEELLWYQNAIADDLMLFNSIHPVLRESIIWSICKHDSSMKELCENVVNMISRISLTYFEKLCSNSS